MVQTGTDEGHTFIKLDAGMTEVIFWLDKTRLPRSAMASSGACSLVTLCDDGVGFAAQVLRPSLYGAQHPIVIVPRDPAREVERKK